MEKIQVLNTKGEKVNDIKLNKDVWAITPNDSVLYDALTLTRNSLRQGTADTKTRSEVSGGGRKPWKQKRTGRARQGSTRAPHWPGGGIVFGPHPRSYSTKMNKKERRLALKSALSYKAIESKLVVIDSLDITDSKTKTMVNLLNDLKLTGNILIVTDNLNENIILASRNLANVILLEAGEINTYDVIAADVMVATEGAIKKIEEALV